MARYHVFISVFVAIKIIKRKNIFWKSHQVVIVVLGKVIYIWTKKKYKERVIKICLKIAQNNTN